MKKKDTGIPHEEKTSRLLTRASTAVFLALVGVVCCSRLWGDDDLFWHLATGRWIAANGAVPSTDLFGLLSQGTSWVPFEWGWDLITYGLFRITGNYTGIQILTSVLWGATFFLLLRLMKNLKIPAPLALAVSLATLLVAVDRMTPRPHSVTAFFLALTLSIYYSFRSTPSRSPRALYPLPFIFALWANLHPGVVAGIALQILLLLTEYLYSLAARRPGKERPIAPLGGNALRALGLFTGLSCLAMLVNPHGTATYTYLVSHTQMTMLRGIDEWLPPFEAYDTFVLRSYKILLIAAAAALFYSVKRKDPVPLILYAAAVAYSLRAVRFMADFAVVTAAGTSLGIKTVGETFAVIGRIFRSRAVHIGLILLAAFAVYGVMDDSLYLRMGMYRHFGTGIDSNYFSMKMIDFLKREQIAGRVFNQLEIGGLLEWERPGEKTFIDTRNLSDSLGRTYFAIMTMSPGFDRALGAYGIDYIVLHPMNLLDASESMQQTPIPYLTANRNVWKLVYWDDQSFVYLRNIPKFSGVIARNEYKVLHPYLYSFQRKEYDSLRTAMPGEYRGELTRKRTEEPAGLIISLLVRSTR